MPTYKCNVSRIDEELNIIVLYPERSKYLRWKLPNVVHLIQQDLKINNSFDIFQLDCASKIREAHQFILEETEVEIRKATAAIWKSAEEGVKTEYYKINMEYKKAYEQRNEKLVDAVAAVGSLGTIAYNFGKFNDDGIVENVRKTEEKLESDGLGFDSLGWLELIEHTNFENAFVDILDRNDIKTEQDLD
ncbi:6632_t:CDS:2, partial [Funneliformis mosseae]